jgi:hypothetical protein
LAESFKEAYGSKRGVLPMMMMVVGCDQYVTNCIYFIVLFKNVANTSPTPVIQ